MSGSDKIIGKNRFFVNADLLTDRVSVTDPDLLKQWRSVLRYKKGSQVVLVGPKRLVVKATIQSLSDAEAVLSVDDRMTIAPMIRRDVTLYCSQLKRENFEWVVQKAVEVGVRRIVPIIADRTVKLGFKRPRLETIIREAAEQSGRNMLPILAEPMTLAQAIDDSAAIKTRFFFVIEGGERVTSADTESAAAFIGPEGGWSEDEKLLAAASGLVKGSLGTLVLRAETAAVIASYLLAQG